MNIGAVKCRITGNSLGGRTSAPLYDPSAAELFSRKGYIRRFSYNCAKFERAATSASAARSSGASSASMASRYIGSATNIIYTGGAASNSTSRYGSGGGGLSGANRLVKSGSLSSLTSTCVRHTTEQKDRRSIARRSFPHR